MKRLGFANELSGREGGHVDRRYGIEAPADQNRPIRVGIIDASFVCQGLTNHIVNSAPGMRVVAISNTSPLPNHPS
jgi:predicted homoserine dehydrogenase-like protein